MPQLSLLVPEKSNLINYVRSSETEIYFNAAALLIDLNAFIC